MKIEQLPTNLQAALPILQTINQAGFEAYFVGGCVRDTVLQKPLHDVDLATSAYPEEIKQIFARTADTGIEHGTVTVITHEQNYEITTFRTESGYQDYRRPDKVQFVRSLEEDLKRRDFTINALAMDASGNVIDLFGGLEDLQSHVIKAVGLAQERFHEDALRMLRAVRFQAQLGFSIDDSTLQGIADNAALLQKIAVERINEEWIKMMCSPDWKKGLQSMVKTDLYKYCPQFANYDFKPLLQLDVQQLQTAANVWTLLCFLWKLNPGEIRKLLRAWKTSNETLQITLNSADLLAKSEPTDWDLYQVSAIDIQNCVQILQSLQKNETAQRIQERYNLLPIHSVHDLVVDGRQIMQELNLQPGPKIGQYLQQLQQQVILHGLPNEKTAIIQYLSQNVKNSGKD